MGVEWIVAGVLLLAGVLAAAGFYLGQRDPVTRAYKPGMAGLFTVGRIHWRSPHGEGPGKDPSKGSQRAERGEDRGQNAKDGGPRAT